MGSLALRMVSFAAADIDIPLSNMLPHDIMLYILANLPVKSLLRFRCVSKSWLKLRTDSKFIDLHKERSRSKCKLIFKDSRQQFYTSDDRDSYQLSQFNGSLFIPEEISDYNMNDNSNYIRIKGSCDGLVFVECVCGNLGLFLWNPATREYKNIVDPRKSYWCDRHYWSKYSFYYNPGVDDYEVLTIIRVKEDQHENYHSVVLMYSLRKDSWSTSTRIPYAVEDGYMSGNPISGGKLISGLIYWYLKGRISTTTDLLGNPLLIACEMGGRMFREVPLPDLSDNSEIFVMEYEQKLSMLTHTRPVSDFILWVMKEYGLQNSWIKQFIIPRSCGICSYYHQPLCLRHDGSVLMVGFKNCSLCLYEPQAKSHRGLPTAWCTYEVDTCGESCCS